MVGARRGLSKLNSCQITVRIALVQAGSGTVAFTVAWVGSRKANPGHALEAAPNQRP